MKLVRLLSVASLAALTLISCSKSKDDTGDNDNPPAGPPAGSKKTITVDVTYQSGLIENSTSYAIWPVAKFPVDSKTKTYSVKFYGFNGIWTNLPEKTFTWKAGELPPTEYSVFPSTLDIKSGEYYISLSRTWCAGCTAVDPQWEITYKKGMGTPKADITYAY